MIWQCTNLPPGCTIKTLSAIFPLGWGRLILMSPLSRRYPCIRTYRVLQERVTSLFLCRFSVSRWFFIICRIIRKDLSSFWWFVIYNRIQVRILFIILFAMIQKIFRNIHRCIKKYMAYKYINTVLFLISYFIREF